MSVTSTRALGAFPAIPGVRTYSGASSLKVDGAIAWTFAEAIAGARTISSFAGVAAPAAPLSPTFALDGGVPRELVPLDDAERALSRPEARVVIWPSGSVLVGGELVTFWTKFLVRPGFLDFEQLESGLAHIDRDTWTARDRVSLFAGRSPAFGLGPLVHEGFVYSWACVEGGCILGRAPIERLTDASAWQAFASGAWTRDLRAATRLIEGPPGALSLSFNRHLGKFLVVHSEAFTDKVVMRTADRPEGPWSPPVLAFVTEVPDQYAGQEQPALASECGDTLVITYFGRTARSDVDYDGRIHAVEVKLR